MDTINAQDIEIIAIQFNADGSKMRFESYPRKLVYKGREYILADA